MDIGGEGCRAIDEMLEIERDASGNQKGRLGQKGSME